MQGMSISLMKALEDRKRRKWGNLRRRPGYPMDIHLVPFLFVRYIPSVCPENPFFLMTRKNEMKMCPEKWKLCQQEEQDQGQLLCLRFTFLGTLRNCLGMNYDFICKVGRRVKPLNDRRKSVRSLWKAAPFLILSPCQFYSPTVGKPLKMALPFGHMWFAALSFKIQKINHFSSPGAIVYGDSFL